eukprot:scpid104334/ scgid21030/ 
MKPVHITSPFWTFCMCALGPHTHRTKCTQNSSPHRKSLNKTCHIPSSIRTQNINDLQVRGAKSALCCQISPNTGAVLLHEFDLVNLQNWATTDAWAMVVAPVAVAATALAPVVGTRKRDAVV